MQKQDWGPKSDPVQIINPWSMEVNKGIDPDKVKFEEKKNGEEANPAVTELSGILKDILSGDPEALKRPEFTSLNIPKIKYALDWLASNGMLDDTFKALMLTESWRLNFRSRPPTAKEFLSTRYLGPTAETLWNFVSDTFISAFDPIKPYRTIILNSSIGSGKSFLTVLINLYISCHFALMIKPYKYFGMSPATQFTQVFAATSQKKGSELLFEPMLNVLESSEYFQKVRTHEEMIRAENDFACGDIVDHIPWTTSTPTSVIQMANGVNYKLIASANGLLGQSQPLTADIYLPDGSTVKLGSLKVGDIIASPTEGSQTVLGYYPKGVKKCYRITLADGRSACSSPDHLWKVSWQRRRNGERVWHVLPLQFLLNHPDLDADVWDSCPADGHSINPGAEKRTTRITGMKRIEDCEQACIYVSGKDHMYITNDRICTHNTILTGSLTELSFFREAGWSDEKVLKFFKKLRDRIDSRMHKNYYGRTIIDSSPDSLENPIDDWIWHAAPESKDNFIVGGSRWKNFPENFKDFYDADGNEIHDYSKAFALFKGGNGKYPSVLETPAMLDGVDATDIIWCPRMENGAENYYDKAKEDPLEFMRDFAAIPAGQADRIFYDNKVIEDVFDNGLRNQYASITAPELEQPEHLIWTQIKDQFFNRMLDKYYFYYEPDLPRVLSIDQSTSGDSTNISLAHVERDPTKLDPETGDFLRCYVDDFNITIIPKGGRINLDAIRYFVVDLIKLGHIRIRHVSFDNFQSEATVQFLKRAGIPVDKVSVDRTNEPYLAMIDYAFKRRIHAGRCIFMKNNFKSLYMSVRKGTHTRKIDHMPGDIYQTGNLDWATSILGLHSKDSLDALTANIYLLDLYAEEFPPTHLWKSDMSPWNYESAKKEISSMMSKLGLAAPV